MRGGELRVRNTHKPVAIVASIGAALLLVCLAVVWHDSLPDHRHHYEIIQEDVTTDTEVEAMFGPAIEEYYSELTPPEAHLRGFPVRPDGSMTVTMKVWWYDDDHFFQLGFDERGIVILKGCRSICPPRSAIRRRLRELNGLLDELCFRLRI
jgi:hypothetical protein